MNEILAPCGSYETLVAALNAGTDAIYIGMKKFSARKNAENFSDLELSQTIRECHKRGGKVYVALNTLIYDSEFEDLAECVTTAAKSGVDAVIIQDLGAARLVKQIAPELPVHASTQMTLNSVSGVKAAEAMGFSRVVIGRELSKSEIVEIADNTNAELEVFVHGALCVSVSGQCYMSSIFGGRSGNRGLCAQPCRLDFTCDDRHNVISLKDQSLIDDLSELDCVASYKIEGRMKRPEYVACAVDACRKSLSGLSYDSERLSNVFSRGGLTQGYFDGTMSDMNGIRAKEDVDNSSKALVGIKELYKSEYPRIVMDISAEIRAECPVRLNAVTEYGTVEVVSEVYPECATGKPLTEQSVAERLSKLGGTQFVSGDIKVSADDGMYVTASALNSLRRIACERMEEVVLEKNTPQYHINSDITFDFQNPTKTNSLKLRAEVHNRRQLEQALSLDFELIYTPMGLVSDETSDKKRIVLVLPLILTECEKAVKSNLEKLKKLGFAKAMAHTLAHAELLRELGFEIYGGFRMNILNSLSAKACADFGFSDITVSIEGKHDVLTAINSSVPKGLLAYGKLPLMLMRRCPIANGKPCGRKSAFGVGEDCGKCITDRKGNQLSVLCGGNSVEILNPDVLIMSDKRDVMQSFDFCILKFTTEADIVPIYDMYKNNGKPKDKLTRGLYFRGAE